MLLVRQRAWGEHDSMAKLLGLTQPAIGYSVERGEIIARKEKYDLLD